MRTYDDPIEVRKGRVGGVEAPEQFLWHDRLWQVREVVGHWVETGAWWQGRSARAVVGDGGEHAPGSTVLDADLLAEREVWRVVARPGRLASPGVFDLVFRWAEGDWRLIGCED